MDDLDAFEVNPGDLPCHTNTTTTTHTHTHSDNTVPCTESLPKPKVTVVGDTKTVVSYELIEDEDAEENAKKKIKKV